MNSSRRSKVLLTRSAEDNALWAAELRERGFEPVECACLEELRLKVDAIELEASLHSADWLSCTSRRSADALHDASAQLPEQLKLAAIGPATAERLQQHFGRCDMISTEGSGADLGRELIQARASDVLVIAARGGLTDIESALHGEKIAATRVEFYEMRAVQTPLPSGASGADAVFFASPSAVRAFAARGTLASSCAVVSLGPSTSAALLDAKLPIHAESRTRDLEGMISAYASLSPSER